MKPVVVSKRTYNTDTFMLKLWMCLHRDFASSCDVKTFPGFDSIKVGDIHKFRDISWPSKSQAPIYMYKVLTQLETLFKRYRFQNDKYTDEQLEELTNRKFLEVQEQLAAGYLKPLKLSTTIVVQRARRLIRKVLGNYDSTIHDRLCRFGKRASQGNPAHESYIDLKLNGPLTGSVEHIAWFKNHLQSDKLLSDIVGTKFVSTNLLYQTNVNKSYKIKRGITPNTTIGSFYTSGLGKYIELCLRRETPIDIRFQPILHGQLAKRASRSRKLVTADLRNASHCYTTRTLNLFLPRSWYNACTYGAIKQVVIEGEQYSMESIMTMGIGFTFPLQTLIFYSIVKSVGELLNVDGNYSVFGDDLIYPTVIHKYVKAILEDLGFALNTDKTFVSDNFRESCGQDFFHGVDVRPFNPEGEHSNLSRNRYATFLYKNINGLLQRWSREEIPQTFRLVLLELLRVQNHIYQVPPDYPDYSGIRVESYVMKPQIDVPWVIPKTGSNCELYIRSLGITSQRRVIHKMDAYLWDALRAKQQQTLTDEEEFEVIGTKLVPTRELVTWVRATQQPRNYRSKLTGKRIILMLPTVGQKLPKNVQVVCHTGVDIYHRRSVRG